MKRTLGLDLGTNSIGWAIVEEENGKKKLAHAGSVVFPEGVARVKGAEQPRTLGRTRNRATRRLYFRRRMRKQRLLRALVGNGMCPLSEKGLNNWIKKDEYPREEAFTEWFKSNPYELRAAGLERKLTLQEIGRILYHFAQRRGFKSNRKDGDGQQLTFHEGIPDRGIKGYSDTLKKLEEYGTIGRAGVALAKNNEAIRKRFVRRTDLEKELKQIWDVQRQHHPQVLNQALEKLVAKPKESAIFFQRPLKSKKGNVGRCTLEKDKPRAPLSAIEAEVFSILHTINTIKVDDRSLTAEERAVVLPRFFMKSNKTVPFADIEKQLKSIGTTGKFKFSRDVKFTGSRTVTWLADLWNEKPLNIVQLFSEQRDDPASVDARKLWDDRWSAIYNAEDFDELSEVKANGGDTGTKRDLKEYAKTVWGFDEKKLDALEGFKCKQGYHSLSRKALRRIIPHLYTGTPYHDAVLLAGLPAVFGTQWTTFSADERAAIETGVHEQIDTQRAARTKTILTNGLVRRYRDAHGEVAGKLDWNDEWRAALDTTIQEGLDQDAKDDLGTDGLKHLRSQIEADFKAHVARGPVKFILPKRIEQRVKDWLADNFALGQKALDKLYHHSAIETYPRSKTMLGSPALRGLNNPMVMRALYQLRKLTNRLIELDWVDEATQVNIEMTRELDSANRRKAWERYQREIEKKRKEAAAMVEEAYGKRPNDPTRTEILKVLLYEEAKELWKDPKCIFTGERIGGIKDLLDSGDWEIEHIWPRSKTNDNSQANKVLCLKEYNTSVKRDKLPPYLPNYAQDATAAGKMRPSIASMLEPIEAKVDGYIAAINVRKENAKRAATKEEKDKAIQDRWYFQFKLDYWKTKLERLTAKEIKPGFLNRQLVATGQITRQARAYMNSYFNRVASYKPEALTSFRRVWLGEDFDAPKNRDYHTHHAKDAVVAAAVDRDLFDSLAHHYEQEDNKQMKKPFRLPWPTFTAEVNALEHGGLVTHTYTDVLGRVSRYRRKMPDGTVRYATGDTVRGSLHKDTFYGRIKLKKEGTDEYEEHTVLRRSVKDMSKADFAKVVDPVLRQKLQDADPDVLAAKEGLPVLVSGKEQVVKRVRTFEKSVKNPVPIKAHRDQKSGAEHKHWLWVKNDETPLMAIYENEKGKRTHYVFSLLELTRQMHGRQGRDELLGSIPREHPERKGFYLVEREGKPYVLRVGQTVILYQHDPEEVQWSDQRDMNSRTYIIRKLEGDGRINLVNALDARGDDQLEKVTSWDPAKPYAWLRFSVHGLKGLVAGLDKELDLATGMQ
jgi:CRISPR-associated endonuclease Csn1